jgi:hypothetical protein
MDPLPPAGVDLGADGPHAPAEDANELVVRNHPSLKCRRRGGLLMEFYGSLHTVIITPVSQISLV